MIGTAISHYRVVEELGRGGMGIVYKAEDTKLDRTVALKVLPTHMLGNQDDRARFFREARAAAAIHHPNIATVFEIDDHGDQPFIAMEFVDGEGLDERVSKGPLALGEAVEIVRQIAGALKVAHEKNIVHRDVKSANIMLTANGTAKILDFGLAKTAASTKLTQMGATLGTVSYMSPEQATGDEVDGSSDLWSLGVVLYELVSGRLPFRGDYDQAVIYSIRNEQPEPLTALRTGVPMELERIVEKCLTKDPKRRYRSAADLIVDLNNVLDTDLASGTDSRSATRATAVGRRASKSLGPVQIAGLFAAAATVFFGIGMFIPGLSSGDDFVAEGTPMIFTIDVPLARPFVISPALTPNSRTLVYFTEDYGSVDYRMMIHDLTTGTTRPGPTLRDVPLSVSASPDSRRIAVGSDRNVYLISLDDPVPVHLVDWEFPSLVWNSDGRLFFGGPSGLYHLPVTGAAPEKIIGPDEMGGLSPFHPSRFDGDRLFVAAGHQMFSHDADTFKMGVVDLDSRKFTMIRDRGAAISYLPTGHLLYVSGCCYGWYLQRFDSDNLEFIGAPELIGDDYDPPRMDINDNGLMVRFRAGTQTFTSRIVTLSEDQEQTIMSSTSRMISLPRASPVDNQIVATQWGQGGGPSKVIIVTPSGTVRELPASDAPGQPLHPLWAPNGRSVFFIQGIEPNPGEAVLLEAKTDGVSPPKQLFAIDGSTVLGDISPDGSVFLGLQEDDDGNDRIVTIDRNTGTVAHPVAFRGRLYSPRFSPDGSRISVVIEEDGELVAIITQPSSEESLRLDGYSIARWSGDNELVLSKLEDQSYVFYRQRLDPITGIRLSGRPVEIARTDPRFLMAGFDVDPKIGAVLQGRIETDPAKLDVRVNYFAEAQRRLPN